MTKIIVDGSFYVEAQVTITNNLLRYLGKEDIIDDPEQFPVYYDMVDDWLGEIGLISIMDPDLNQKHLFELRVQQVLIEKSIV